MILRVVPQLRPMVWGNWEINKLYGEQGETLGGPVGEVWLLSDHPLLRTSLEDGTTIQERVQRLPSGNSQRFPLLVKLVSTQQWLSVQVHPDDDFARKVEGEPWGKSEAWYFLTDGKFAICEDTEALRELIERGRLNEINKVLRFVDVKAGTVVNLPAGTVHALGPNSTVIEVQQSSDLTYRIYDWGRPRETHLEKASVVWRSVKAEDIIFVGTESLNTPHFTMLIVGVEGAQRVVVEEPFAVLVPAELKPHFSAYAHFTDADSKETLPDSLKGIEKFIAATLPGKPVGTPCSATH